MKNARVHLLIVVAALVVAAVSMLFPARSSRGQSAPPSPSFVAAAARNATLRNELTWTFDGKQQRGWYFYDSLIGKTLNTEHDSTTSNFAAALAAWQKKMRLSHDGVLDENSLMRMISQWQRFAQKVRPVAISPSRAKA